MTNRIIISLVLAASFSTLNAQDWAVERIEASPRHHEWVSIPQGDRQVQAFLVYPEVEERVPAVVVIHENRGLTDWVRSVADQLAEAGYIAIAPDLLSGMGPDGGRTSDFPSSDAARQAIYRLPPEQVTADLNAVAEYVAGLPASSGIIAVGGFCWGGSQTFRYAASGADIAAAYVFYGTGPDDPEAIARIQAPVYGFYGGNDARVGATIPTSERLMEEAGKTYEPVTYEGAGHGFMRSGEQPNPDPANQRAREHAWERWKELLGRLSEG